MQPSSGLNRSGIKMNALDSESGGKDLTGKTSDEEKNGRKSFQHNFSGQLEEEMEESEWEDGSIPILNSSSDNRGKNLIIEFDGSPKSASRKPIRRASAQEKELAELAHKVHLLCLIARGRLIDEACDDPFIQASLLSLLPVNFLNISEVSNLTVRALAPLVHWFHSNFRTRSLRDEERSIHSALAFALESREGTPEEIAALSVALFRALNLTTRFVSILDVASLKPDSRFESPDQDASRAGTGIFKSSTIMVDSQSEVSVSPVRSSSSADKENICQNSIRVASKDSSSTRKNAFSKEFRVDDELAQRASDSIVCEAQSSASEACDTKKSANPKRKGDLEFEMQMEMAFSATAVGVQENSMDSDVNDLHINSSQLSFPIKRMKRVKCGESKISSPGISTAVGSRKVGAPLYWAEVYCSGENLTGKWVHCDAVNAIIDGEREVEAEAAACKKSLRYVVAFAGHGAKDVTRRYCMQWYKVASQRVNSVWWDAVLAPLKELESGATGGIVYLGDQRVNASNDRDKGEALTVSGCPTRKNSPDLLNGPGSLTVDRGKTIDSESSVRNSSVATRRSLEDMELETRALTEPLPTNQQAYKNHQLYAIEKWLTKYQMLHPKGPILGFCSGHPVYPRACVQTLKTKNRWLREGLQIKSNELPSKVLKRSTKLSKSDESGHPDYVEGDFEANISLYGKWQTEPLCLPCAANGIVPKNERGQVDVWSEKCLPPGTVHLRLARVVPVAKRLEVDFAPAMVGFEFRNGHSIPVYDGIVVCAEVKDAILEAYAEEEERREAEEKKRNEIQAISRWYQLLSSIITRQRLNDCYNGPVSSQISTDTAIADQERVGSGDGDVGKGHSLVSQQEFARDTKLDTQSTLARGNHEHIFLTEDQIHDEDSLVLTKRCRCGFSVQVEQL